MKKSKKYPNVKLIELTKRQLSNITGCIWPPKVMEMMKELDKHS